MEKDDLIKDIVDIEWPMFSSVNNVGGKAACQMDPITFKIMRVSQYKNWSDELLKSWLNDLRKAKGEGRNLASEKYARMMERTFPEEFEQLKNRLPPIPEETLNKIDEIINIHLDWKQALDNRYPFLSDRGRPLRSSEDVKYSTPSLETYMRSELRTYSPETIDLYHAETLRRKAENRSEAEENLLNQVKEYDFKDLDAANEYFANHQ